MTREEINNTPELVDFMLDECVLANSRRKVRKRLEEVCDLAIKVLEQEPKTDWISVSERLPEREGWYLVSLKNGNVQKAWYRVAPVNQGGSYWRGSIKRPIAWMPLPEPYRQEGGER